MRPSSAVFAALFLGATLPCSAGAQLRQAGDRDPSGRILAKIIVTMTKPGEFGRPVAGLRFLVVAENGDRTATGTDDAGVANVWLNAGTYRFVTPDPVIFEGKAYTWDTVVPIRAGGPAIRLSDRNAVNVVRLPPPPPPTNATRSPNPDERQGLWFNAGLGYGNMGCKDCVGRINGLSGGLALGGTVSPSFLAGVGATVWTKSENSRTLTVATYDARVRYYPAALGGFFINGGIGFGSISSDLIFGVGDESGLGLVLGIGMDFRLSTSVSLTPFVNGVSVQTDNSNATVGQIGVGLTFQRTRGSGLLDF